MGVRLRRIAGVVAIAAIAAQGWIACGGGKVGAVAPPAPLVAVVPSAVPLPSGVRLAPPQGHLAGVRCLSFSPSGLQLVSGGDDSQVLVWDVDTGEIAQRLDGHTGFVTSCQFVPEGHRIVTSGAAEEVFLWDVRTGERVRRYPCAGMANAYSLAVRPDGRELEVGAEFGDVRAWDLETGAETFRDKELDVPSNDSIVWTVGYTAKGERFAGSAVAKRVLVWGTQDANTSGAPNGPRVVDMPVTSGVALPGGGLALGVENGTVLVDAKGRQRRLGDQKGYVNSLAANPRGDLVVAGDGTGLVRLWEVAARAKRCGFQASSAIHAVAFDAIGERFAVAGTDGSILVASAADCHEIRRFAASRSRIFRVGAGASVALGDGAGRVSTWSPGAWALESTVMAHVGDVNGLAALPDGRWVSAGFDRDVHVVAGGVKRKLTTLHDTPRHLTPIRNGSAVLATLADGTLTEIHPDEEGGAPTDLVKGTGLSLMGLAVAPSGRDAIVGGQTADVTRVPLDGGERVSWARELPGESVTSLAYLPDGRWLEGGLGGGVLLRRGDTGEIDRRLKGLTSEVDGFAVVGGAHIWASSYSDGRLVRWSVDGGPDPDLAPIAEGAPINDLVATPDGRFLVTALGDGRAAVRALPDGTLVAHLVPLRDGSWATLFADGRFVTSGCEALALRLEDPATRRVFTLDNFLELSMGQPSVTRLHDGSVEVHATVFSSTGPPSVDLDGRWPVTSVVQSPSVLSAYDVDLLLDDRTGAPHRLRARAPARAARLAEAPGAPRSLDCPRPPARDAEAVIRPDPVVGSELGNARALVIGNERYPAWPQHGGVTGAYADAEGVGHTLESLESWGLRRGDRFDRDVSLVVRRDLDHNGLPDEVRSFFANATPQTTLLLYFSGHGTSTGDESYLLPTDYAGHVEDALSVSQLWTAIRTSPATRIVVILDACRAGGFGVPPSVETQVNRRRGVVILTAAAASPEGAASGTPSGNAKGTPSGGLFTRALIRSLGTSEARDPVTRTVTVYRAYLQAGRDLLDPIGFYGDFALASQLTLGRPKSTDSEGRRGALNGLALLDVEPMLVTDKLLAVDKPTFSGEGLDSRIELPMTFVEETGSVNVRIFYPNSARPIEANATKGQKLCLPPDGAGPWSPHDKYTCTVPIAGLARNATYRIDLQPCRDAEGLCQDRAPRSRQFTLAP